MHVLHHIRADVSISPEIKLFISENIDLLSHEIYKRLVERGLDLNIRQNIFIFGVRKLAKIDTDEMEILSPQK
ncbi:8071_t:CDS:1, partial [Funneliformis geosporum]